MGADMIRPIILITDFGADLYVGQVKAALIKAGFSGPVIDLMHDLPPFDAQGAGHMLAACLPYLPDDVVIMAVVDPGVGSARLPLHLSLDGRDLVGPDNGLFEQSLRRSRHITCRAIDWRPAGLSASFHGRDLFAPAAAAIALGHPLSFSSCDPLRFPEWGNDLSRIIYIDRFGNLMTGIWAQKLGTNGQLRIGDQILPRARTFSDLLPGQCFCYENSNGLMEIAANGASAAATLKAKVGDEITVLN